MALVGTAQVHIGGTIHTLNAGSATEFAGAIGERFTSSDAIDVLAVVE